MTRVITYGTYDLFHQGHYNILKRAKALGDYLIVAVTSEIYDLERGKLNVRDSLLTRIENVRKTGFADKIIVEEYMGQKISDVVKYDIDILVVGSDWYGKFDYLKRYCDVVYLERTKNISSTQLREQQRIYGIGIAADGMSDGGMVLESKYVSGVNVEGVFMEDAEEAARFAEKYELAFSTGRFDGGEDDFLSRIDIAYIRMGLPDRFRCSKAALLAGKHVICDAPATLRKAEMEELLAIAKEKGVLFIDNLVLAYLRALSQLTWMLMRGLIGELLSIRCSIRVDAVGESGMAGPLMNAILVFLRILGNEERSISTHPVYGPDGSLVYNQILFEYENRIGCIEISSTPGMRNDMEIIGTGGRVDLPDEWWNMGYFEASEGADGKLKRYSFNFEGNGERYLLHELLLMIQEGSSESRKLLPKETEKITGILEELLLQKKR